MKTPTILLLFMVLAASCAMPLDQINGDRRTGVVILQIEPSDAEVYLDGRYIGHADRFDGKDGVLKVALGGHVLMFKADEFENELREVLAKDAPQTISIKMLPKPKAVQER